MARRVQIVTIADAGRDKGKQFRITEMPADQAERFAIRLLLALANAGAKVPDLDAGMAALAASLPGLLMQGIRSLAGLRYEDAEPLLDEMLTCVEFMPPGSSAPPMALAKGAACQIEDVRTRLKLRYEVLQVHVDFSLGDLLQSSTIPPSPGESP